MNIKKIVRKSFESNMEKGKNFEALKREVELVTPKVSLKEYRARKRFAFSSLSVATAVAIIAPVTVVSYNYLTRQRPPFQDNGAVTITMSNKEAVWKSALSELSLELEQGGNRIVSPASRSLIDGTIISLSSDVKEFASQSQFDPSTASMDTLSLLKGLNWRDRGDGNEKSLRSMILQQQIGDTFDIDVEKVDKIMNSHLVIEKCSPEKYQSNAIDLFQDEIGASDISFNDESYKDTILTYCALSLSESFSFKVRTVKGEFHTENEDKMAKYFAFDHIFPYYEGNNYKALLVDVDLTSLLFILPEEESSFNFEEAVYEAKKNLKKEQVNGKVPYFSVNTELATTIKKKDSDQSFFNAVTSKNNGLDEITIFETSSFSFDYKGITGGCKVRPEEPIVSDDNSIELDFNCDRSFYCVSIYDDFPIFASKIVDPTRAW